MEKQKRIGHIAVFAANILFGLNTPVSRSLMPEAVDPYLLTFFRLCGGMLLFWFASAFVREKVGAKDVFLLFFAAALALTTNQLPFIVGLSMTSPIDASIVVTMLPILSMLFAAVFIREPITLKKTLGVLTGASGALLLVFSGEAEVGSGSVKGNLLVFGAVMSFALYLTLFKKLISKYKPVTIMKWMFLFASIQSLPFYYGSLLHADFTSYDRSVVFRVIYVVVVATFVTYILLAMGQKVLRPTTLSMYNYLQPVVATLAAVVMGIDAFGIQQLLASVLVFAGVYLVTRSKSLQDVEVEVFQSKSS
ncbi:MAG: EamA family transporter [Paludibacteraceae bacterium]|nr:EamA family transporter [Paludibacteraceae bacterium]